MDLRENVLETLGNTPLVKLRRYHPESALLAGKVEYFNPGSSVKDRIGIAMIEAAEPRVHPMPVRLRPRAPRSRQPVIGQGVGGVN